MFRRVFVLQKINQTRKLIFYWIIKIKMSPFCVLPPKKNIILKSKKIKKESNDF